MNNKKNTTTYRFEDIEERFENLCKIPLSGKFPQIKEWQKSKNTVWYKETGIICGKVNNLVVFDFDCIKKEEEKENLEIGCGVKWLLDNHPSVIDKTFAVRTNSKCVRENCCGNSNGIHLYFQYDTDFIKNGQNIVKYDPSIKIDLKTDNGFVKFYENFININKFSPVPASFKNSFNHKSNYEELEDISVDFEFEELEEELENYIVSPQIIDYGTYLRVDYNHAGGCPFGEIHNSNGCRIIQRGDNLILTCFSGKCKGKEQILKINVVIKEVEEKEPIDRNYLDTFIGEEGSTINEEGLVKYLNNFICFFDSLGWGFRNNRGERFKIYKDETTFINSKCHLFGSHMKKLLCCWKFNRDRLCYEDIYFGMEDRPEQYNLFTGYKHSVVNFEENDIEPFKKYIYEILANENQEVYDYLILYFAHLLQYGKNEVLLGILGEKGIGKSLLINLLMENIVGKDYSTKANKFSYLLDRFNSQNQNKLLVFLDEPADLSDKNLHTQETLKDMITGKWIRIEKKGQEPYEIENLATYILATNGDLPIKWTKGNRRYFMIKASNKYKGNLEFFKSFNDYFKQKQQQIFSFLMTVDLSGVYLQNFPITETMKHIEEMSKSPIDTFIEEEIDLDKDNEATKLHRQFNMYLENNFPNHTKLNVKMFLNALRSKFTITEKVCKDKLTGKSVRRYILTNK